MDLPSPRMSERAQSNEDDESKHALSSLWNWAHSLKFLQKALSVLVVSSVLAALGFSSFPLWRPMGALLLHKLWDVLRFLVLTTSIGLGILNSGLWRGAHTDAGSVASNSEKEDSLSSKVPFAGMFYGEVQPSDSFSEEEASEDGLISKSESEIRDVGPGADAATPADREHAARIMWGGHNSSAATVADPHQGIAHERDGIGADNTSCDQDDGPVNEEIDVCRNAANLASRNKHRLVKTRDDIGIAAVIQQPKQNSSSKIVHRRGSSLEFPIAQEWGASIPENDAVTNHQSTPQEKLPSSDTSTSTTDCNVAVHANRKGTEPSGRIRAARPAEHPNADVGISGGTLKHSRSQSAYNLNELQLQQRPRSKPSTSGQLSKRRNVSLSCDLDNEYAHGGMPAWLASLPSPPEPPLIYGYDVTNHRVVSEDGAVSEQDESSRRRAFTESLAPWRAATNTMPVNIPASTHKQAAQSNKDSSTKTMKISAMEKQLENINPSSSPSTSNTMGSPSPGAFNKKVDAFIARFHEQMRLQRLESLKRSKQRGL